MAYISTLQINSDQANNKNKTERVTSLLPYYVELYKANNKTIKIPCASEMVAKKLLDRVKGLQATIKPKA